ncbi:hypothetical protein BS78_03G145800 [Paspalum vaginatum]|nr:hypothetical protein BS78_03G145800 [Paspalum vaginatum]
MQVVLLAVLQGSAATAFCVINSKFTTTDFYFYATETLNCLEERFNVRCNHRDVLVSIWMSDRQRKAVARKGFCDILASLQTNSSCQDHYAQPDHLLCTGQ